MGYGRCHRLLAAGVCLLAAGVCVSYFLQSAVPLNASTRYVIGVTGIKRDSAPFDILPAWPTFAGMSVCVDPLGVMSALFIASTFMAFIHVYLRFALTNLAFNVQP